MGGHRCYLRYFGTTSSELLQTGLQSVIDYIWREVKCDDIRIELIHSKDE
jgi:hypothetical protein